MSLRNRIAFYYMAVTALFIAILFFVIYNIVQNTVYNHLDSDLNAELSEVSNSIFWDANNLIFTNTFEWTENEHGQIEVNPTFIQIVDTTGKNIKKTINLRSKNLIFHKSADSKHFYDIKMDGSLVRQIQVPLKSENNSIEAYIMIAIPFEESALVLSNLKYVLFISFPVVLLLIFSISRLIAGKIIAPVNTVTTTAELITRENMNERIPVPSRKDELYKLTSTINSLLDRLQDAVIREQQFTADASHELRTPIAVIRGTLEVLIRKDREPEQYKEKIKYVISETDRMAALVDQLLYLARYESGATKPMISPVDLRDIINNVLKRFQDKIAEKSIRVYCDMDTYNTVNVDTAMMEIIIENLLSNAIKYSDENGEVAIKTQSGGKGIILSVTNFGIVIPEEQLADIFNRFHRVDQSRTSQVQGSGLGLAIVKRLTDMQGCSVTVDSSHSEGTIFKIQISS
ncbi:MAG: histidine kinase dimerization/phospho-acceptor domain-containing protein [Calditrichaceae bacterium]